MLTVRRKHILKGKAPDGEDVNYQLEEIEMEKDLGVFIDNKLWGRRGDMIDTYKYIYVHKIYQVSKPHFPPSRNQQTRGNVHKIDTTRSGSLRSNFFAERVVSPWNTLPDSVVTAPSVNSFKSRLDHHWRNHPIKYEPTCCQ